MDITASMVKALREKTGVGMMTCKKALQQTDGNIDAAIDYLRKKGEETATKREGKSAKEGMITTRIKDNVAYILEVNSETDFVAKNEAFISLTELILDVLEKETCSSVEELLTKKTDSGLTVNDSIMDVIAKLGEKISIKRFEKIDFNSDNSRVYSYIHGGGKIGVLAKISTDKPCADIEQGLAILGKDLTLQIAASSPLSIDSSGLDAAVVEKEKEIYRSKTLEEGKPEKIVDKIVEGRMNKYYQEVCLLEQPFIKENKQSVKDVIAQTEKTIGAKITVDSFIRLVLGGA